ncbi:MAG TPA: hypothetical protein VFC47_05915 [Caulobacteraceae bacterium]|nr:hypothetical protein [Caulobacteraceae bacterium]
MDYSLATGAGAAVTAAVGVVALLVHVVRYAYTRGETNNRLESLEKAQDAAGATHSVLASLSATVGALEKSIARLDTALERMRGGLR